MNNRKRILVVDDGEDIRKSVSRLLRLGGYEVCTASDGVEALQRVRHGEPIHLLILDLWMPRLAGLEMLSRLQEEGHKDIAVIILTAKSAPEDLVHGCNQGADFYLTKPFDPQTLRNAVDFLIGDFPPEEHSGLEARLLTADGLLFCIRRSYDR